MGYLKYYVNIHRIRYVEAYYYTGIEPEHSSKFTQTVAFFIIFTNKLLYS